jgi:hypothetical protein
VKVFDQRVIKISESKSEVVHQTYIQFTKEGFEDLARRTPVTFKLTTTTGWRTTKDFSEILTEAQNQH